MSEWISVTDRFPKLDQRVLICLDGEIVFEGKMNIFKTWEIRGLSLDLINGTVTDWQPLPAPPGEEND